MLLRLCGRLGRNTINTFAYIYHLSLFFEKALYTGFKGLANRASRQAIGAQVFFTGIGALPVLLFLALLSAAAITTPAINLFDTIGQDRDLISILSQTIVLELAPLATALILINRSASAIVIDLGNMSLRGEVQGLELLAIDINQYLVAPRVFAAAICQLFLSVYFAAISLYGGIFIAGMVHSHRYLNFVDDALMALSPSLLVIFIIKNLVFGGVIAASACYQALHVEDCVTQIPQQAQKALVRAVCLIFVINAVFLVTSL